MEVVCADQASTSARSIPSYFQKQPSLITDHQIVIWLSGDHSGRWAKWNKLRSSVYWIVNGSCKSLPDASYSSPDTSQSLPDASKTSPDASQSLPDASYSSPDASKSSTDASQSWCTTSVRFEAETRPARARLRRSLDWSNDVCHIRKRWYGRYIWDNGMVVFFF